MATPCPSMLQVMLQVPQCAQRWEPWGTGGRGEARLQTVSPPG